MAQEFENVQFKAIISLVLVQVFCCVFRSLGRDLYPVGLLTFRVCIYIYRSYIYICVCVCMCVCACVSVCVCLRHWNGIKMVIYIYIYI